VTASDDADALRRAADTFAAWWRWADHLLVGAGAGLSAAAGIDYGDRDDFARRFPVLAARGFSARYQLIGFDRWSPAEHWAYWATHVDDVRFRERRHPAYGLLHDLAAPKDHFVLSSNVDGMFARHGFDEARLHTPQGDYALLQCRTPCRQATWSSRPAVERALAAIDPATFRVGDPAAIPACPACGGEVFLNVRLDDGFVETPWREGADALRRWLGEAARGRVLLLEVGAGYNTPSVVRWPMEQLAAGLPQARLVRVNRDHPGLDHVRGVEALTLPADAGAAVAAFRAACLGPAAGP
jgi:NAD-dependent SIR2 family protein deacetylase